MNGKIYTMCRDNPGTPLEREKVVCLDAATGKILWENKFNVYSSSVPDTRVGWSSVVCDPTTGKIYALGVCGYFQCLEADTGKTVWSVPMHERFGLLSTYGGRTNFPLVVDDLVIVGAVMIGWGENSLPAHRFIAFDKLTGEVRWFNTTRVRPEDTIYSAPTLAVFNGVKVFVVGSGDGWLYAFQPATGKQVWEYEFSRRGLNLSPTVDGDIVYMGHSEENPTGSKMGAIAAIKGNLTGNITKTGEIWKDLEVGVGKSAILKIADRLYCFDDSGKLQVFDAATGEPIGRRVNLGTINFASPLYADGKIYHLEKTRWYILTPDEKNGVAKYARGKTMGMFDLGIECWASPIVSHGRLYIQTTGALYCFEDKTKKHGATEQPKKPDVLPVSEDPKPAQALLVPADVLMRSGDKQQFTVKLYNSHGQFLKDSPAKFELAGPGTVSESGELSAPADSGHVATYLTAKAEGLTALAKIRIIPPLPWKFDFDKLKDAPVTWIGARYRHQLRTVDGSPALVKITTIPKGTRSRLSMGPSDLSDYTIQADVKAATQDTQLPDIGIIAQGYTFFVSGQIKKAQIQSWMAHDKRSFSTMPFTLEPNVWYTMKLRAENSDGKAFLRAKIWKRDEKEPDNWTLELVDPQPNSSGSPGMYADSTNAEVYIDNVTVVPNS
jgi:outer membrane protein assembly factor BamB